MKRSAVVVQLLVTALFAAVGGFVAVSVSSDAVDADRGEMTAAVPMMTEAQLRVGGATASSDLATTTITPVRILDTRVGAAALAGSKTPWGALETRTVEAAGLGTIPSDAVGVVVNVTVLNATAPDTFLTLFPTGTAMPNASTINPQPSEVAFNAATVLLGGDDGTFEIYNYSGTVDVIIDVTAYMTRTLADNVDDVSDDIERVQTGEQVLTRRDFVGGAYYEFYKNWKPIFPAIFGAPIETTRYLESDTVEARVIIETNDYPNSEICVRIRFEDGADESSEVCANAQSEELTDGYQLLVTPRVPVQFGMATLEFRITPQSGYECGDDPADYAECYYTIAWSGFFTYGS